MNLKHFGLYKEGKFFTETGNTLDVYNPATSERIGSISYGDRPFVREAIDAADRAFSEWRMITGKERGTYLFKIIEAIQKRATELAEFICLENGKPIEQARAEVNGTIDHFRWFAEEARRGYGRIVPNQAQGKRHLVVKQPKGVVGAIPPWNFPLILGVRKMAPALAAGCTVVLKPASDSPLCCGLLAECVHEAGLPSGVFNLVSAPSSVIADEMIENPKCKKITFTGSTGVGRKLMQKAATYIKDLSLELGGNGPLIVFKDADITQAVEGAIGAKFRNTGQSCIAANRIFVHEDIAEEFVDSFLSAARNLKVGPGIEEGMDVGPLIHQDALKKALHYIELATSEGAEVRLGGHRLTGDRYDQGTFLAPTVLTGVHDEMSCMREEVFAPIAPIVTFRSYEEVIRRANDTEYGLSAFLFTTDLSTAIRAGEDLESGTVGVNDGVPSTTNCPFGGVKQSGLGRELGKEGMEAFQDIKHISLKIKENL